MLNRHLIDGVEVETDRINLCAYISLFDFFLLHPATPIRPAPRRIIVEGSGVGIVGVDPIESISTSKLKNRILYLAVS
jgi:hypothetical protein